MSAKHSCVQGDNFAYDFACDEVPVFDANWTGAWAIVQGLDDKSDGDNLAPLASGSLTLSGDSSALEMRIPPSVTEGVPVGKYYLVVQVTNASIGFNQEIMQDTFEIREQGI